MPGNAVAFLIPIHNRWDLAEPMLASLLETTSHIASATYVVIDDGSDAQTRAKIAALRPPLQVVRNEKSLGFGAALNRAIRPLTEPLLVLLNSDLVLKPGWLEPMLEAMARRPAAFAVGNLQSRVDDGTLDHAGIVFHEEGHPIHFRAPLDFVQRETVREFPAVTAACCVIRRDRFVALGGFDESYRNGFEDIDLCLRARLRGWPSFVANRSCVGHHISASPGRKDAEDKNARLFLERWRPLTSVWQRDWENRLLRERNVAAGQIQAARPVDARSGSRIRVLMDLARLAPGGANGGIKVLVSATLASIRDSEPAAFSFLLVVPQAIEAEAIAWIGPSDEIWTLPSSDDAAPAGDPRVHRLAVADHTLARCLDADVLYCPLGVSDFLTPDVPVIGVAVDLLHRELSECLPAPDVAAREVWFDRMVRTSFRIQCNSHWVAGRVQHHFAATSEQLFVVHNAVHTRLGALPARSAGDGPVFLYPANAWPHKNHDTLLVAYRLYRESAGVDPWPLVLTGHADESMARIAAHARALGLADHVIIRGFLSDGEFLDLWARCGALVFPSLHEGFGIPILEAMHFGVPVIAGRTGSIPEVAADACLYTDVRDPRDLAAALHRMNADEGLRADLIARGQARASQFSFSTEIAKLTDAFRAAATEFRAAGITWHWDQT